MTTSVCNHALSSVGEQDDEDAEERTLILEADFTRAEFLRDRLLLKAVLYYTGEAVDDEEEDEVCSENRERKAMKGGVGGRRGGGR